MKCDVGLFTLVEYKVFLFISRGKAQNADQMHYRQETIAVSSSRRGGGRPDEPVGLQGSGAGWTPELELAEEAHSLPAQLAPITQLGPGWSWE